MPVARLPRTGLFLWGGLCALSLVVLALRLRISTDVSEFMPAAGDLQRAQLSKAVVSSELSRTLLLSVQADDAVSAAKASEWLEAALRGDEALMSRLVFLQTGPPQDVETALWQLYEPHRLGFVATSSERAKDLVSDVGLRQMVTTLKQRLASPLSAMVSRVAPGDPFLTLPGLFEQLAQGTGALAVVEGRFVAQDRYGILLLGTKDSAFSAQPQRAVLERVKHAFAARPARLKHARLEIGGLGRFSVAAEQSMKADIQRITTLSVIALMLVCYCLFRSLRLVLLAMVPVASGMLFALVVCLLIFGQVHGLTVAFGASLIGVCVDYVVHFYVHHLMSPARGGPGETMRRVWPGLLLGAATTGLGFLVLGGSAFPGLQQVAVFASVGVLGALLTTRWVLPYWIRASPRGASARELASGVLGKGLERLRRQPAFAWGLVAVAAVGSVIGLVNIRWQDDLSRLTAFEPELVVEDARVRARVAQFDQSRFVVAVGANEEHALRVNDALFLRLEQMEEEGALGGYQNAASLLRSKETQLQVHEVLRKANLRQRLGAVLSTEGFRPELFESFFEAVEQAPDEVITYAKLVESPVGALVRSQRVSLGDQVGFVTFLRDVTDAGHVERAVHSVPGATFIDQKQLMTSANEAYRTRLVGLMWVGLLGVFVLLLFRYRNLRLSLSAFVPAVLAAGLTVGVLSVFGKPLNLLGLASLLMVLSIGVDYGVFLTESLVRAKGEQEKVQAETRATLLSLVVAWASTVCGFGVLALSSHPALQIIGLVAAVGVTASLLLAPTAMVLLGKEIGRETSRIQ